MGQTLRERRSIDEGYSLIELMVVVLIIAILIAIAIPTFQASENKARDRTAQTYLRHGLTAVKTVASDDQGLFMNVNVSTLGQAEGALSFQLASIAVDLSHVSIEVDPLGNPNTVELSNKSSSGIYFGLGVDSRGAVTKCKGTASTDVDTYAHCIGVAGRVGAGNW